MKTPRSWWKRRFGWIPIWPKHTWLAACCYGRTQNRFPHDLAAQSYERAIALNPKLDEAHHQLALVYLHVGLLDKGWAQVEQALAVNPANTMARFRFGVIDLYRGRNEEALAIFDSTPLEKNPALLTFQKAAALLQLGRIQEATTLVDEYLATYRQTRAER